MAIASGKQVARIRLPIDLYRKTRHLAVDSGVAVTVGDLCVEALGMLVAISTLKHEEDRQIMRVVLSDPILQRWVIDKYKEGMAELEGEDV
jgi:hypothetical protein